MRNLFIPVLLISILVFLVSCSTTDVAIEEEVVVPVEVIPQVEPDPVPEVIVEPDPVPEVIIEPDPVPEIELEYSRSTTEVTEEITFDIFQADKLEILEIIRDLDEIMKTGNYGLWREYITPNSISYWSNRLNLQVLTTKLFSRNIVISNLRDYFLHMFIPSRIGHGVNEIRYISSTEIKAVQVISDTEDLVYYNFSKIDGKWLVKLPTL